MIKLLIRGVILAVAVGGPVMFFKSSDLWSGAKKTFAALTNTAPSESDPIPTVRPVPPAPQAPTLPSPAGPSVNDLAEVLRFDVTTGWITGRWPRVSIGMAQLQFQGYRVPLVTGTEKDDLAGSLTYYFDPHQQVQIITFNGTTGDPTKLLRLLTGRYGFVRRVANDSGLFLYEAPNSDGQAQSMLRIRLNGVVKANQSHQRFRVDLTLARPAVKS
ncbi:MAG: hypothetical protein JW818_14575 [Pirellulales bacterium]|nr:hypothetical protein [Pirellulales bacterium]